MKRPNPDVTNTIELSILMPCLHEAGTLGACIEKARMGIERSGVRGKFLWRTTAARIVQCKLPKNVARALFM
jgi:hypothetical protein